MATRSLARKAGGAPKPDLADIGDPAIPPLQVAPSAGAGKRDRAPNKQESRRQAQREELWPDSSALHFNRHNRARDSGFITIPRSLSIVCAIIQHLTDAGTARVYWDLWCRSYDEGFVEIHDERTLALSSGFKHGTRHVRTWQTKMRELEKLGFILIRAKATSEYGYALLVHPHFAVARVRAQKSPGIPPHLVALFDERVQEVGGTRFTADALEKEFDRAVAPVNAD